MTISIPVYVPVSIFHTILHKGYVPDIYAGISIRTSDVPVICSDTGIYTKDQLWFTFLWCACAHHIVIDARAPIVLSSMRVRAHYILVSMRVRASSYPNSILLLTVVCIIIFFGGILNVISITPGVPTDLSCELCWNTLFVFGVSFIVLTVLYKYYVMFYVVLTKIMNTSSTFFSFH